MAEVASQLLNYNDKAMRGVSSRSYRVKQSPSNGSVFTMGSTINIDLPANQANSFFDFGSSYFRVNLKNGDATSIKLEGGNGIYNLIKKVEVHTGGQTISSIDNYNILVDMLLDMDTSDNFKNHTGAILLGTGSGDKFFEGDQIATGANKDYVFCLAGCPLFNANKYIPAFGADSLRLKLTLNTAASAVLAASTGITDAEVEVSDIEFIYYMVELSNDAMAMVSESVGGVFDIVVDDYRAASSQVAQNDTTLNAVCGFAFSSLNRVLVAHRPQSSLSNDVKCSTNRARADLTEINLLKNGESIPQRSVLCGDTCVEPLAELLVADKAMGVFSHTGSLGVTTYKLTNPAGTSGDVGTFMVGLDTEGMRSQEGKVFTGVNTIGSVVSVNAKYDTCPSAMEVNIFANYTLSMSLDMGGSRTFVVAL